MNNKVNLKTKLKLTLTTTLAIVSLSGLGYGLSSLVQAQDQTEAERQKILEAQKLERLKAEQDAQSQSSLSSSEQSQSSQSSVKKETPVKRPGLNKSIFTPLKYAPKFEVKEKLARVDVEWKSVMQKVEADERVKKVSANIQKLDKAVLNKTTIPVLMPRDGSMVNATKARLMSVGEAYALNMPQPDGLKVVMFGNKSMIEGEQGSVTAKPFAKVTNMTESVQITRLEDGWTATFERYGVVYALDVLCDVETICQDDSKIKAMLSTFSDIAIGQSAKNEAEKELKPAPSDWFGKIVKDLNVPFNQQNKGA